MIAHAQYQPDEPILAAAAAASEPPPEWCLSWKEDDVLPDEQMHRVMGRLAARCTKHLEAIRKRAYCLGHDVDRAVRIYSHGKGLAVLARRIQEEHGRSITPQTLGNARTIYRSYTRDGYENQFSTLSDTHLLEAQRFHGGPTEEKNKVLEEAQKAKWPVSKMLDVMKGRQKKEVEESAEAKREALGPPPAGYIHGNGKDLLKQLPSKSVGLLRFREPVPNGADIEMGRVLSSHGVIVLDCPSMAEFPRIAKWAGSPHLRIVHTLIVVSDTVNRAAPCGLPIMDRYRLAVLMAKPGRQYEQSDSPRVGNPMTEDEAETIIYRLVPDEGHLIDVGRRSLTTALWATGRDREYLALEPDRETHSIGMEQLSGAGQEEDSADEATAKETAPSSDPWSLVPAHMRESVELGGAGWDELACCDRTILAATISGQHLPKCLACGNKVSARNQERCHV